MKKEIIEEVTEELIEEVIVTIPNEEEEIILNEEQ